MSTPQKTDMTHNFIPTIADNHLEIGWRMFRWRYELSKEVQAILKEIKIYVVVTRKLEDGCFPRILVEMKIETTFLNGNLTNTYQ